MSDNGLRLEAEEVIKIIDPILRRAEVLPILKEAFRVMLERHVR
jgi:hypothetical protein